MESNFSANLVIFILLNCFVGSFILKKKSEEFSPEIAIPIFYRIIQDDYHLSPNFNFDFSSNGLEKLILNIFKKRININPQNIIDFRNKNIEVTEYKHNLHHPSEFLSQFITSQFKESDIALAQCIISDSFSNPCCILYLPQTIAEGAAILAAAMNENKDSVIPKTLSALSYINDFKRFFEDQKKVYESQQQGRLQQSNSNDGSKSNSDVSKFYEIKIQADVFIQLQIDELLKESINLMKDFNFVSMIYTNKFIIVLIRVINYKLNIFIYDFIMMNFLLDKFSIQSDRLFF